MTRRLIQGLVLLFAAILLATMAAMVASSYFDYGFSRLVVTNAILSVTSSVLVAFLFILIARYAILTLFAFLHHLRQSHEPLTPTEYPPVSLILPAHNEGPVVEAAINAALSLDYPNYEVILVDDGSTDDTYARAQQVAANISSNRLRIIHQSENRGKAHALNIGIAAARGELVLCSDADSRLESQSLTRAVVHFKDPRVAAVAGNVKVANRRNGLTRLQALEYLEGLNLVRAAQAYFNMVTVIPGPFGVFRKDVLQDIGGYHEDTFAEDCDLTLRLMLAGWHIKYEKQAVTWTEAPEGFGSLFRQRYRWGRGVLQAIIKNRHYLLGGCPSFAAWLVFWLFTFDGVALPAMNLIGILLFGFAAAQGSISAMIPLWWAQLMLLDCVVAMLCIAAEREQLRLTISAIPYRLFFVPFGDMMRLFSWFDELFRVRMKWGRLERAGRI